MLKFTRNETAFFEKFHKVWKKATSANSLTAVYDLADGKATWDIPRIDWEKRNVTFADCKTNLIP